MKKYLAKSKLKSVYVENGKATKVFAKTYNKSDVLYKLLILLELKTQALIFQSF